jgi:hypothetical protein
VGGICMWSCTERRRMTRPSAQAKASSNTKFNCCCLRLRMESLIRFPAAALSCSLVDVDTRYYRSHCLNRNFIDILLCFLQRICDCPIAAECLTIPVG